MTDRKPTLVKDMIHGLRWGATMHGPFAHILKGHDMTDSFQRAECGVFVLEWSRKAIRETPVCKRCLKATEKYA